jgi:hypothetical protein
MSTKYFIWIVRVPICLWEFPWSFCDFRSFFCLYTISSLYWNCFRIKNKFGYKNTYPILLGRARIREPDPPPSRSSSPQEPIWAERAAELLRGTAGRRRLGLGVRGTTILAPRAYKR